MVGQNLPGRKIFVRDLAVLMGDAIPWQMLEISFNGRSFQPVLIQAPPQPPAFRMTTRRFSPAWTW